MLQHCQHFASDLTMGRLHLWPVCPGSSQGLSAISCWLFRRGRLSSHLLLSSAPLPVIIEADTVPPWLPSYIASTTSALPPPFPSSHPSFLPLCALSLPKNLLPRPGWEKAPHRPEFGEQFVVSFLTYSLTSLMNTGGFEGQNQYYHCLT